MITQFAIRNFKSLRDVHVHLERFTVFVGPNASGKSSMLQALDLLCQAFRPVILTEYQGNNPTPVVTRVLNEDIKTEFANATSNWLKDASEIVANANGSWCRYRELFGTYRASGHHIGQAIRDAGQAIPGEEELEIVPNPESLAWKSWGLNDNPPLPLSFLLRLETAKLIRPTPAEPDPTAMNPDGTGLHSALASMALNDPDSWQELQKNLRQIIPTIRRLRHTPSKPNLPPALLFDTLGANSVPATHVSEGTLLVLGLLAALHGSSRPSLVLLDDLDRGLHPKAQKELISLLRGLLETRPDLQIVATTHSPYMLDCMETNEVRMTLLRDDGSTVCADLVSHPKFEKWKDEMTPGEMWSLFGEKWLVEGEVAT